MYDDFFDDFNTEWELNNVHGSKSSIILLCNQIQEAILDSNNKWEDILEDANDVNIPFHEVWIRAITEACGFCHRFERCSNCIINKPCRRAMDEFHVIGDEGLDRERFIDFVEAILLFLDELSAEVYHYKLGVIRDITGIPEYDDKEGEK